MEGNAQTPQSAPPIVPAGARIGETYRVIRNLGEGSMGLVVLAYDETLEREVAIKLVRSSLVSSGDLRERFLAEARAMARVNHHNVVRVYAFGEHEGAPYFVMEYVPGWSLDAWVVAHRSPGLSRARAVHLLGQICQGVAAIHAANTIHGDLKPANIRLGPNFRAAVTDLGLARVVGRSKKGSSLPFEGSPAYMAPEIIAQAEVLPGLEPRVDVYALGCIAHELLVGKLPVSMGTERFVDELGEKSDLELPSVLRPGLPPAFDAVLMRALSTDPSTRTPTAQGFLQALHAANDGEAAEPDPYRILIAEDDADFREVLTIALRREFPGAEIEPVGDGQAALDAYKRRAASIAVIDLRMPGLDGLELTARLREADPKRTMPIIVLTASGGATEWQKLSALGADGFLVKPVNLVDVVTLVRRALGERLSALPAGRDESSSLSR